MDFAAKTEEYYLAMYNHYALDVRMMITHRQEDSGDNPPRPLDVVDGWFNHVGTRRDRCPHPKSVGWSFGPQ